MASKYNVADKERRRFLGIVFDSRTEGLMYLQVAALSSQGLITYMQRQKEFVLQEAFIDINKRPHRKISYICDFYFYDIKQKRWRVIDTKGFKTEVFKIKEKLFNYKYKDKGLYIEYQI